ncbi:MAG: ornithine carbamoyltransferase [Candidatus Hodarchaeaceae archaeon]|nr:ornithine carbamoyltransferase [Candidatus Hodarchaeaceae archaeon]
MLKGRHLLSPQDLSPEEIIALLDKADELKQKLRRGEPHEVLHGKTLGMIFAKPSTRTRVSFEAAMTQLGGHAIYLGTGDLQLGRGETIADTARTLSRYVDAVMARLFKHEDVVELARNSSVPVINGLTELLHPCQTLADLQTIREKKGGLEGLKLAWVGDGNNVCNSLLLACTLVGMNISVACPKGYEPNAEIVEQAQKNAKRSGVKLEILNDPKKAVKGADVIYTDVFVSMGHEAERERRMKDFKGYQVNAGLLKHAKEDVIFMHCLPAHRGEEVTAEVIDGPHSVVFDQAENRLHSQKAILCVVM